MEKGVGKIPVGGENDEVLIDSKSLVLSDTPFDNGSTCRMYQGTYQNNGIPTKVACKEFLVRITPRFRRRIEKEAKCIMRLKHPNILQHFGLDFRRSILVTEYMEKEVTISGHDSEHVHNARQLIDTLEDDLPWQDCLDIIRQASNGLLYLHEKQIVHCDIKTGNIFYRRR